MNTDTRKAQEVLAEAYGSALDALRERALLAETPAVIAEKERSERVLKLAGEVLDLGILHEDATREYLELEKRIASKKESIQRFYGIAVSGDSLQAVRDARAALSERFENALRLGEDEFTAEAEELRRKTQAKTDELTAAAEAEIAKLEAQAADLRAGWKLEAERERSEFEYQLGRARKQDQEEREGIVAGRERDMAQIEREMRDRRDGCLARLKELDALQKRVDGIPALLEKARAEGAAEKAKELNREYGYQSALSQKDREHKIDELRAEYERLSGKYQALCQEKTALSQKLDACNAESRKLTSDTVRSIGGINILNTDGPSGAAGKK